VGGFRPLRYENPLRQGCKPTNSATDFGGKRRPRQSKGWMLQNGFRAAINIPCYLLKRNTSRSAIQINLIALAQSVFCQNANHFARSRGKDYRRDKVGNLHRGKGIR